MREEKTTVPIIKWVGGKRQLLEKIRENMPEQYDTYFEPFFGGGAVFFELQPEKAIINDFNPQLANLYKQVRNHRIIFLNFLKKWEDEYNVLPDMKTKDEYYYKKRKEFNDCLTKDEHSVQSAALLVFLNKSGFNGLYRVNQGGLYNVPASHKVNLHLFDEENVKNVSKALKNATIYKGDFEEACKNAKQGDFVFFDSPYYDTFDTYQAGGFSADDHKRLFELYKRLTEKGVYCMATNNNCEYITDLYKDYRILTIPVKRMVNRDANHRTGEEVMILNYDENGEIYGDTNKEFRNNRECI